MAHRVVNRFFAWLVLLVFLAVVVDLARAVPVQLAVATDYLVRVTVTDPADVSRLADTGLPVYERVAGGEGEYVLLGADPAGLESLAQANLPYTILDTNPEANIYYLVMVMPNQPAIDWSDYGRVLLDDGRQLLVRQSDTGRSLAEAAAEISLLTYDPKPLFSSITPPVYPEVIDPDPIVQSMINQVLSQTVYQYDGNLSGEWPVTIGGSPYTIVSRHSYSGQPLEKATEFVGEHLANLGLPVEYHDWHATIPPNVIGQITGQSNPDDIFIIGAHLDDMPSSGPAPGADDNASGSVGVLIAADIFTQFEWDCTLRFVLWTGEEQGLLGSKAYALRSYNLGENILGVLNLDMIAWNTADSSPDMDLHAKSTVPGSVPLAQLFSDVVSAYNLDLVPQIITNGSGASDHASFWTYNYPAILAIEDYYGTGDFNPYYHTSNDLLQYLDLDYFTAMVKASVATFAHMTGCMVTGGQGAVDGTVTSSDGGTPIGSATVDIWDSHGTVASTTTDAGGYYTQTLFVGTYTVTVSASGFYSDTAPVAIITDTVTTLNFALDPIILPPGYDLYLPMILFEP
jgi:hypothetical protein